MVQGCRIKIILKYLENPSLDFTFAISLGREISYWCLVYDNEKKCVPRSRKESADSRVWEEKRSDKTPPAGSELSSSRHSAGAIIVRIRGFYLRYARLGTGHSNMSLPILLFFPCIIDRPRAHVGRMDIAWPRAHVVLVFVYRRVLLFLPSNTTTTLYLKNRVKNAFCRKVIGTNRWSDAIDRDPWVYSWKPNWIIIRAHQC